MAEPAEEVIGRIIDFRARIIAKADESPLADPERLAVTWRAYKKLYGEDGSQQ